MSLADRVRAALLKRSQPAADTIADLAAEGGLGPRGPQTQETQLAGDQVASDESSDETSESSSAGGGGGRHILKQSAQGARPQPSRFILGRHFSDPQVPDLQLYIGLKVLHRSCSLVGSATFPV
jgi:hypothetical protein